MARKRISNDGHKLSQTELNRRFSDKHHSIDDEMKVLFSKINWDRRKEAEKDIVNWVNTYCIGVFLEDKPPKRGEEVLRQMWQALDTHNNYMILLGRGAGKSCFELCTTMASISQGIQKFIVIVSNNTRAASDLLKDIWRMIQTPNTPFAQDYPEIVGPYALTNGSLRRRQLFNGQSTELSKTSSEIVFPTLIKKDGTPYPTSGSVVTCRGLNSGIRGLRKGTQRVTCVLLDDLQDKDIATSPEQVQKVLDTIKKDIIPLAGKDRLSIIQTATPICPDDLVERIQQDKTWKTTLYPAIISYPKNISLWQEYFTIYDGELMMDDVNHTQSLNFYKEHFIEMNEGSEVFNPTRFSIKDGHISMIQKLLELEHNIGHSAFQAEYQMSPIKDEYVLDINQSKVAKKINSFSLLEVPDDYRYVTFGIDINPSYAISVVGMAWKVDTTGIVIYHKKFKCRVDQKLPDTQYNNIIYQQLDNVMSSIKNLNIKIDGIAIDCGGRQWDAVNLFCKNYKGLPVCAFAGRSSTQFEGYKYSRGRLKDAIGGTVLCGDKDEINKGSGKGFKYVFFDADWCKHSIQLGLNCVVGDCGSISLYNADPSIHSEFITELCNEKIKTIVDKANGTKVYSWHTQGTHDDLDCCSMNRAVLSQLGITSSNFNTTTKINRKIRIPMRKKIRII